MTQAASALLQTPAPERAGLVLLDGAAAALPPGGEVSHAARISLAELAAGIRSGETDVAIVAMDDVGGPFSALIGAALAGQPAWSDFPFILVAHRGDQGVPSVVNMLGHVWIVEQPIDPTMLEAALAAAARSRDLQRAASAGIERQARARSELVRLAAALEDRVGLRLAELQAANRQLTREAEERRAAEARLEESEEVHRHTIELTEQILWTTGADGNDACVGPRFYELTGLPPGTRPRDALHPEDKAAAIAAWTRSIGSGTPHSYEFRFVMEDGSTRHFCARAAPRRDGQGRIVRWYGTFEDIHERKLIEQASAQAEERYRLAARATNDVVWDLDIVHNRVLWSPSAARLFGMSAKQKPTSLDWWEERVHPDERGRVAASLQKAIGGRRARWSSSYRFRRSDGSYADVLDRGFIIRDEDGRAVRAVGAMSDLTERRQNQAEIQQMRAELIHVSRLSAMGQLASTLAHELNQPLTAVTGYVRGSLRLLEAVEGPVVERVCGALAAAEAGALRAGQIVRRLRELVARGNVAVKPEPLGKLLDEASELAFVDARQHGVSHRIELDHAARWVAADRIQIQQVLINLVRNAIQAMADRPRREVLITTRMVDREYVEVGVSDSGGGLSPERMAALFSPFDSSKEEGLGIGLSISRTIVEAHGGKIWAENNANEGATFRFTLPTAEAPDDARPAE